jgi:hypothetical protein
MTNSIRWTDSFLDEARQKGDPLADAAVAALYDEGDIDAVNRLMKTLVLNDGLPPDQLPKVIRDYLAATSAIPELDIAKVRKGEAVFGLYGPECLMVLGFYSLPAAYAAKKGVQVLYRTAYLLKRPVRRVLETTQMVIDVMARDGLGPNGKGIRTAQKVRLMHAAVRHLLTHDPASPWDPGLGVPINQEDLAGTLMTFSFIVMEGLAHLGIDLTPEEAEAYLHAWHAVGEVMGLDPSLLPENMEEAKELTFIIRKRQIAASDEGKLMTAALVEGMQTLVPEFVEGLPASMIRFFLEKDVFMNEDIAGMLGVPKANWTSIVVRLLADIADFVSFIGEESHEAAKVIRFLSRRFVSALLTVERGGNRPGFDIPVHLQDLWKTKKSQPPSRSDALAP